MRICLVARDGLELVTFRSQSRRFPSTPHMSEIIININHTILLLTVVGMMVTPFLWSASVNKNQVKIPKGKKTPQKLYSHRTKPVYDQLSSHLQSAVRYRVTLIPYIHVMVHYYAIVKAVNEL